MNRIITGGEKINKLIIDDKYIIEYIQDMLNDNKIKLSNIKNDIYHHNSSYNDAPSIIKYGIIPINKLIQLGIIELTEKQIDILNDTTSHINGTNGISLSRTGLSDLYNNELEYNPYSVKLIDFLISDSVKAARFTEHYGNEFITFDEIKQNNIESVDLRILKFINQKPLNKEEFYNSIIDKYNNLIIIAKEIKKQNLNIPIREMSNEQNNLDVDGLLKLPFLVKKPNYEQIENLNNQKVKKKQIIYQNKTL